MNLKENKSKTSTYLQVDNRVFKRPILLILSSKRNGKNMSIDPKRKKYLESTRSEATILKEPLFFHNIENDSDSDQSAHKQDYSELKAKRLNKSTALCAPASRVDTVPTSETENKELWTKKNPQGRIIKRFHSLENLQRKIPSSKSCNTKTKK